MPVKPELFTQFRKLYSSSSLTTELVIVQDGQFVVRATAIIDAQVLATAMAANSQLEMAEDAAINRLWALLGLQSEASTAAVQAMSPTSLPNGLAEDSEPLPQGSSDAMSLLEHNPQPAEVTPKVTPLKAIPSNVAQPGPPQPDLQPSSVPSVKGEPKKPQRVAAAAKVVPISKALPETEPDIEINLNPIPDMDIVAPEEDDRPIADIPDEPSQISNPEPLQANSQGLGAKSDMTNLEKSAPNIAATETGVPTSMPASTIAADALKDFDNSSSPVDLSDIIAQTDVEMGRLGWTSTQGRKHLEETYHKRSRQQLNDEELLEFLLYLESQPTPVV